MSINLNIVHDLFIELQTLAHVRNHLYERIRWKVSFYLKIQHLSFIIQRFYITRSALYLHTRHNITDYIISIVVFKYNEDYIDDKNWFDYRTIYI